MPPWRYDDYTAAWICALPLELAAACAMLDERHRPLPRERHSRDNNTYILGRVESHNVVIACLPSGITGTVSAARVVNLMLSTFRHIQFGLMIGIGGGAPSEVHDIRLGDIVVGKPTGLLGGVVQYDFGKTVQQGRFQRGGMLNKPPEILLTALSSLEAKHFMMGNDIERTIQQAVHKYPAMRASYTRPPEQSDRLFQAHYEHPETQPTCSDCDADQLEHRTPRSRGMQHSYVHYGLIASGDQVVRHGAMRDHLRKELDVLCFEMEAAGLIDSFPCLVIRGISDYADSHKNDLWQGYAAAAAAAYAKELMQVIPTRYIDTTGAPVGSNETGSEDHRFQVHQWLSPANVQDDLSHHQHECMDGSCHWAFQTPELQSFLLSKQEMECLRIGGAPGSGKSTLTAFIISHLIQHDYHVVYFFCKGTDESKQQPVHVLGTLLSQLLAADGGSHLFAWVNELRLQSGKKHAESFAVLKDAFQYALINGCTDKPLVVVVDALDECHDGCLLASALITSLSTSKRTSRLLLSSREEPDLIHVVKSFQERGQSLRELITLPSRVRQPIVAYIKMRIARSPHINSTSLGQDVFEQVSAAADGSWLYTRLMLDEIERLPSAASVACQLHNIPHGLMQLYQTIFVAMGSALTPLELRLAQQLFLWVDMADFVLVGRSELDQEILDIVFQAENAGEEVFNSISLAQKLCSPLITIMEAGRDNTIWGECRQRQLQVRFVHHTAVQFVRESAPREEDTAHRAVPAILEPQILKNLHRANTAIWYFEHCTKSATLLDYLRLNGSAWIQGAYFEMAYALWSAFFLTTLPSHLSDGDLARASVLCDRLTHFLRSEQCLKWVEMAIIINFDGGCSYLFGNAVRALSAAHSSLEVTDGESRSKLLPAFQTFSVARKTFFADYAYVISRTGPA
ncbi:uncharacterized protein N7482_010191 [Penicillium canariense]|uniref:Nucleoside phosphorylase domain-containing protein n=1 Tax=Penicillium canariense TaxID=189055 RepID=A0A9W9LDU0_9EURO|nr:uncharacterized protein N7482_010191 [Penicillium canariense]KAJ5150939.1 hypothetical protein N7482_010191 [Penicillium canariense]